MKSDEEEFACLMPFFDQSHSFVHGYECGQIWETMGRGEPIERIVHAANLGQLRRMADVLCYRVEFERGDDPTYLRMIGAPQRPEEITQ